jgi:glycogen debranching enzyme
VSTGDDPDLSRISVLVGTEDVTILDGSSFCRSDRSGNIHPSRAEGLFMQDTRLLSIWELTFDGAPVEPLGVAATDPFAATFIGRVDHRPGTPEPTVVIERHRVVHDGMREDIVVRNFHVEPVEARLELVVDSDFADLFDVKDGRPTALGPPRRAIVDDALEISVTGRDGGRGVRVRAKEARAENRSLSWQVAVGPGESWRASVDVALVEENASARTAQRAVFDASASPQHRMRDWRRATPVVHCDNRLLQGVLERSTDDLGALRIVDPERPQNDVVAAGAPWFMALFGRDSLLTSWFTLPWNPELAKGTLHTLARLQGEEVDASSEEEPGRILHEVRLGIDPSRALGASSIYYGTVDATPLFVMLLGEAARWGMPAEDVVALLPAADRALAWISDYGDVDRDGFVEYERKTELGLLNQGWKDSGDAITFATGELAEGPIALAEVQAYVYGAYRARAQLAALTGDDADVQAWNVRADRLRAQFDEAFWLPDHGYYALALDGDKRAVDSLASNQGHCLWAGIVPEHRSAAIAEQFVSPRMFTGWGVRTLSRGMGAYNPVSYHNGSVWPHDNALLVAGLARYGHHDTAGRIADGLLNAAASFGLRLPELFCGFGHDELPFPVPYPTSCSPQAWAAATPIAMVMALLGVEPGASRISPRLPDGWGCIQLEGLHLPGGRFDIDTERGTITPASAD